MKKPSRTLIRAAIAPALALALVFAPAAALAKGFHLNNDDLDRVENMSAAARETYFTEKREAFKKLSAAEREKIMQERKAWFDNLSDAEKEALHQRRKALREKMKADFNNLPKEKQDEIRARMDKFKKKGDDGFAARFEKMTDAEKAALHAAQQERFDKLSPAERERALHHAGRKHKEKFKKND